MTGRGRLRTTYTTGLDENMPKKEHKTDGKAVIEPIDLETVAQISDCIQDLKTIDAMQPDTLSSELATVSLALISIGIQKITPHHVSLQDPQVISLINNASAMATKFHEPTINYYFGNIHRAAGDYVAANRFFGAAFEACEAVSPIALEILKTNYPDLGDKVLEQVRSAILCNWADLPHHGLGQPKNLDMTIEMYKESARHGMMVSAVNTGNVLRERYEATGKQEDLIDALDWYLRAAANLNNPKAFRLDFSNNENMLLAQSLKGAASIFASPEYRAAIGDPWEKRNYPFILKTGRWLLNTLRELLRRHPDQNSHHRSIADYCLDCAFTEASGYMLEVASTWLVRNGPRITERPIKSQDKRRLREFTRLFDRDVLLMYNAHGVPVPSTFEPLAVWAETLRHLGWEVERDDRGNYSIATSRGRYKILVAPIPLSSRNIDNGLFSSDSTIEKALLITPGIAARDNVFVFSPIATFWSKSRSAEDLSHVPVVVRPKGKIAKEVSLSRLTTAEDMIDQYCGRCPTGREAGEHGQNLAIAINSTLFGVPFTQRAVQEGVAYVGESGAMDCVPVPTFETWGISQYMFSKRSPGVVPWLLGDRRLLSSLLLMLTVQMPHVPPGIRNVEEYQRVIAQIKHRRSD